MAADGVAGGAAVARPPLDRDIEVAAHRPAELDEPRVQPEEQERDDHASEQKQPGREVIESEPREALGQEQRDVVYVHGADVLAGDADGEVVEAGQGEAQTLHVALAIPEDEAERMAVIAKALGDPIRLQLVDLLRKHAGKVCVCELVPLFDVSQPTLSHHLKKLRAAGIVDCERPGLWAYYYVIPEALEELSAWLS